MLLLVLLALFSSYLPIAYAQDEGIQIGGPKYDGIDLVFLVDQSGSMEDNDPFELRADTIKWIMEYLGIDNLSAREEATHRIGIVSFGTGAEVDLPLTSLKIARNMSEADWNDMRGLQANAVAKDLVYTDVLAGLEAVKQVFDEAPPRDEGSVASRGVIILSDGAPYRDGWQDDPRYAGTNFYTPYFEDVRSFIDASLPIAPSPRSTDGFHIWVLGLNAKADAGQTPAPGTSWAEQQSHWESILNPSASVDRVRRLPGNDRENTQMPPAVLSILDTMMLGGVCNDDKEPTDEPSCIIEEEFSVPPYIARADFTVSKPGADSEIVFFSPDGQPLDQSLANIVAGAYGETLETLQVSNPVPGNWRWRRIDSSSEIATVVFQKLFARANVLEPSTNQDLFDTATLTMELLDLSDNRMQELSAYPIDVSARVVSPDGKATDYSLASQGNGVWRSTETMLLDQPGKYQVYLSGTTDDVDGEQVYVFRDERTEFSVGNLKPNLVAPADVVPLFHQVPLQIDLTKADGSQSGVSPQHSVTVEAELMSPDGATTAIDLQATGSANSFTSVDPFTSLVPGEHVLRVRGTMEFAGETAQLFDQALPFTVDCVKPQVASPSGDQPQNGVSAIRVEVENCRGGVYVEDPALPWTALATLQRPDGTTSAPDVLVKATDGVYETNFSPDMTGQWQLSTSATVETPDGVSVPAYSDIVQAFDVYPTTLVHMSIVSPQPGERQHVRSLPRVFPLPLSVIGKIEPTEVLIEFTDMSGRALDLSQISADPDNVTTLLLHEPEQQGVGRPITLSISSDNPTQLVATIPDLSKGGMYKLIASPASLNREFLPDAAAPTEIEFERTDHFAIVTYVLLAIEVIILLAICYKLARAIAVRINPVKGTLEFERVGATGKASCGTLALSSYGKNTFEIKANTITSLLCPEAALSLSRLRVKNASEKQDASDDFEVGQGYDGSAIKLWAWDANKEEIISEEPLQTNQTTFLPGPGGIVIRYRRD